MKVSLWGVRGSIPTSGAQTSYFGGNTACIEVKQDGWNLVFDGGSGMQMLNSSLQLQQKRIDILLTHLHFDHIQGLGFFKPLFDPTMEVHLWGPQGSSKSLRERLGKYFSPPLFPLHFRDLPCQLTLHEIANSSFQIGPFTVMANYVIHPGPTMGYRISNSHSTVAYIPDHEPALGPRGMPVNLKWLSGSDLALNTDLLIHDAQYSSNEYATKTGWGHSAITDAVHFAEITHAKKLVLFHHDPSHTDAQLNELIYNFSNQHTPTCIVEMAVEGTTYDFG